MMYKTITLELIQDRPELYEKLRGRRQLLPAIERYARELKALHEAWKKQLGQARPDSSPSQVASKALELAIEQFQRHLPSASEADEADPLSLDAAMTYIRKHTPPA